MYTLNSEPKALTGAKSEGIKSRGASEAFIYYIFFLDSEIVEIDAGSATQGSEPSSAQAEQSAPRSKRRQAIATGTGTRI